MPRYEQYEYLWPPRPDNAIPENMLSFYDNRGWVSQIKKNGTCSVIAISPDRKIIAMNRHKESHKLWSPTPKSSAAFQNLPGLGWYVFVGELLHSKVAGGPRDTNYLFDILVADGEYHVGKTLSERLAILDNIFPTSISETTSHRVITPNTWVAKTHTTPALGLFQGLNQNEDEGIVLKNPDAKLGYCLRKASNSDWQVKCRRPHKNFGF